MESSKIEIAAAAAARSVHCASTLVPTVMLLNLDIRQSAELSDKFKTMPDGGPGGSGLSTSSTGPGGSGLPTSSTSTGFGNLFGKDFSTSSTQKSTAFGMWLGAKGMLMQERKDLRSGDQK